MFACYMYVQTLTLTPSPLLRRCVMINSSFLIGPVQTSNFSWNLIQWIKYIKSSGSELIRNACFNLEGLNRSCCPSKAGILTLDRPLERLWFRRWTFLVPNANCMNIVITCFLSSLTKMNVFQLTVVCETKWSEMKRNVVCEMKICSLRNENL